jgi:hypothetical protein
VETNETHQFLVYANVVNLLHNNINTIKKLYQTKVRILAQKMKYTFMFCHQNEEFDA